MPIDVHLFAWNHDERKSSFSSLKSFEEWKIISITSHLNFIESLWVLWRIENSLHTATKNDITTMTFNRDCRMWQKSDTSQREERWLIVNERNFVEFEILSVIRISFSTQKTSIIHRKLFVWIVYIPERVNDNLWQPQNIFQPPTPQHNLADCYQLGHDEWVSQQIGKRMRAREF